MLNLVSILWFLFEESCFVCRFGLFCACLVLLESVGKELFFDYSRHGGLSSSALKFPYYDSVSSPCQVLAWLSTLLVALAGAILWLVKVASALATRLL